MQLLTPCYAACRAALALAHSAGGREREIHFDTELGVVKTTAAHGQFVNRTIEQPSLYPRIQP
jgi:hypothetical protein